MRGVEPSTTTETSASRWPRAARGKMTPNGSLVCGRRQVASAVRPTLWRLAPAQVQGLFTSEVSAAADGLGIHVVGDPK